MGDVVCECDDGFDRGFVECRYCWLEGGIGSRCCECFERAVDKSIIEERFPECVEGVVQCPFGRW